MTYSTPSNSYGTSVCRTPPGQPPAVQIGNPADLASPASPPLKCRSRTSSLHTTPPHLSHPVPRRVRPELQTPPPHHPQPCPSLRPRAPCVSSCAHELDAVARASLPHRHRTPWRVWRHVARHRVHRHARGHRQVSHPSRRPQGQLQRPPPRTAAACPASATPSLPITAPIVSAPAVAPRPLRSLARTACLPCVRDCRLEIASPRPRPVCSRTGIEPDNDDTDTAATMSIDGLFYLFVTTYRNEHDERRARKDPPCLNS